MTPRGGLALPWSPAAPANATGRLCRWPHSSADYYDYSPAGGASSLTQLPAT